jgi:hypothetical protein
MRDYSQDGEQKILIDLYSKIGTYNKTCVEFGALDGQTYSNTRHFIDEGWSGFMFDCNDDEKYSSPLVNIEKITAENINKVFEKYNMPFIFDLISIDIDGNDLWVLKALEFKPRVIVIEYNSSLGYEVSKTIPYNADFSHDQKSDYFGASYQALKTILTKKGYKILAVTGLNIIAVNNKDFDDYNLDVNEGNQLRERTWPPDSQRREWVSI